MRSIVVFEQDRSHDAIAVEGRAGDDAGAHLVDQVEHLGVVAVGVLLDAVELQCLRGAAAALVECRDEAGAALGFLELVVAHVCPFLFIRQSSAARIATHQLVDPNSDLFPVPVPHSNWRGSIMTATVTRAGIAPRENGAPPPDVSLADIDLGALEFWEWDDDRRDGAFATMRRESPIAFFEVPEFPGFDCGLGPLGTDEVRRRAPRESSPRDLQLHPDQHGAARTCPPRSRSSSGSMINLDDPRHLRLRIDRQPRLHAQGGGPHRGQRRVTGRTRLVTDIVADHRRRTGRLRRRGL